MVNIVPRSLSSEWHQHNPIREMKLAHLVWCEERDGCLNTNSILSLHFPYHYFLVSLLFLKKLNEWMDTSSVKCSNAKSEMQHNYLKAII